MQRITKPYTKLLAEQVALRVVTNGNKDGDRWMSTTEICEGMHTPEFHGVRTLSVAQVTAVLKRLVEQGKVEARPFGEGNRTGTMYRVVPVKRLSDAG